MKPAYLVVLITALTSLSGCTKDYSLAPPADSEQITVTIKVPDQLKAETMLVVYRSKLCVFTDRNPSGVAYTSEGYQKADIQPERQGQSDLYVAKLPVDGGGACQWRISNVTFGVVYENPAQFGEGITHGTGGGVVVVFDYNKTLSSGSNLIINGDLKIKEEYYPWVDEVFLGRYINTINLLGGGHKYLRYQAIQARNIYFEPVLHSAFVLYSKGPKKKGNYTSFTYPDGSIESDGRPTSKFLNLQLIRKASEAAQ